MARRSGFFGIFLIFRFAGFLAEGRGDGGEDLGGGRLSRPAGQLAGREKEVGRSAVMIVAVRVPGWGDNVAVVIFVVVAERCHCHRHRA